MLDRHQVHSIMRKSFPDSQIISFQKTPAGQINWVYKVSIRNPDKDVILRVFPQHHTWKIGKEKKIHDLISRTDLPIPKLIHTDSSTSIIPYHYQILEFMPGRRWGEIIQKIPQEERRNIYFELGKALGKIHSIKLDKFGWIHSDQEQITAQSESWKKVFIIMCIDQMLDLSQHRFLELAPFVRDFIDYNQHMLDGKFEPRLLHNDFFADNILLHNSNDKWRISGVLDFESAFAGHTEFELSKVVSQLLLDYPSHDYKPDAKDFFRGYKKYVPVTNDFEKRRPIYSVYHLLSWINHCTLHRDRCIEAGINVKQVMDYFYNDLKELLR